jgi:hypothetical protein
MDRMKRPALSVLLAAAWIAGSEFLRNQLLFKSYWVGQYAKLGLVFPERPLNGAAWGLWSLLFAAAVFLIAGKFTLVQTTLIAWLAGFVLMWVVVGNLGVLPFGLLVWAVPLSLFECFVAALIMKKVR